MLRTALLFLCLLGFAAAKPTAASATPRPIHRHKPIAGNYVHVYRTYRGHSRQRNGLFGSVARLFQHRPGRSGAPLRASKSHQHRTR